MASPGRDLILAHVTEAQWLRQVITWSKRAGYLAFHVHDSRDVLEWGTDKGAPDLILAKAGAPLYLPELKTMTGRVPPHQAAWLHAIRGATGVDAPLWRPDQEDAVKAALGLGRTE